MHTARRLRLESDYFAVQRFVSETTNVALDETEGSPPERYRFVFFLRSVAALPESGPVFGKRHFIEVQLPAAYPAQAPLVTALTPLVHPHVYGNGTLCLGGWHRSQPLDRLLSRIVGVLRYEPRAINWQSVANPQAALWARGNLKLLPLEGAVSDKSWGGSDDVPHLPRG